MSEINLRSLKRTLIQSTDSVACTANFAFLQPAFEAFLLCNFVFKNDSRCIDGFQVQAEDNSSYFYFNTPYDPAYPEGSYIRIIAAIELPITDGAWRVVRFLPDGSCSYCCAIWKGRLRNWVTDSPTITDGVATDPALLFIGGAPKSGTTWVCEILNSHPDVLATSENNFFHWPNPIELQELLDNTPPPYFSRAVPQIPPFRSQAAMMYAGRAVGVMGQIAAIAGLRTIADKSPGYANCLEALLLSMAGSKYVHCVRNPLDVAVSRFFHERNLLIDSPELSTLPDDEKLRLAMVRFDPDHADVGEMFKDLSLLDWMLDAAVEGNQVIGDYSGLPAFHLIRYEDLLADFLPTTQALFRFCGLSFGDDLCSHAQSMCGFAALSGGREAGHEDIRSFFRKGMAGDSLNHLSKVQIEYAAKRVMLRNGWYECYFSN